jgi:uncharacterized protein
MKRNMIRNTCLKISPYIFISKFDDETVLATNLSSGEVLQITINEAKMLIDAIPDPKCEFEKSGFLVSDDNMIQQCVIERHRKACRFPVIFNLTLLPTLYCNFSCRYCFEKGAQQKRMNEDITSRVLKLVDKQSHCHLRTNLSWFGGEPLLEKDYIATIHPKIRSIVLSSGCEFTSNITTNGYLLDKDTAELFRELDIKFVQVTIDGNEEVHDKNRITKNGKGTFNRIVENLLTFLETFEKGIVTLRVNAVYETVSSILDTLICVPIEFRNRISVHLHHIMDSKCPNNFSEEFSELIKEIYRKVRLLGFDIAVDHYLDPGPSVYCYAERFTSTVIDPNGYIFRCAYTDFSEKERVGFLDQEGRIQPIGRFGIEWEHLVSIEPKKCIKCTYLPICGFGCPRLRITGANSIECKNRFKFLPDTLAAMLDKA